MNAIGPSDRAHKIRIVFDGLKGEGSIAELCRREGIAQSLYYSWSKEFLEAGKKRLAGDTARAATSTEVKDLRREARDLKEVMAEQAIERRLLEKSMLGDGAATHEVFGNREAGDHPVGRRVTPADETDFGKTRHSQDDLLSLV